MIEKEGYNIENPKENISSDKEEVMDNIDPDFGFVDEDINYRQKLREKIENFGENKDIEKIKEIRESLI